MANEIVKSKRQSSVYVPMTSRYSDNDVIYYGPKRILTFPIYKRKEIPVSKSDRYAVISQEMEFRPDKMSLTAYGLTDYWWMILQANGMNDVYDFRVGVNIRLPALR